MKRYLLTLLIAIPTLVLGQQGISVKSFRLLENDMDARIHHPKKDQNGEVCAIIKVVTTQTGFNFDVGSLGIIATEQKTGEIWLYVPHGVRYITISHGKLGLLRQYDLGLTLKQATVYELVLVTGTVEVIVKEAEIETQWLVINSTPEGADVYLNDQLQGQTPFQKEIEVGKHAYRVEQLLYHPEVGLVTVTAQKKELMEIALRPNFGHIRVNTTPESGATVTINGNPLASPSPVTSDRLKSGVYTVEANKTLFHTASKQVTVSDGETTNVTIDLRPAFGGVRITSSPESGAEILLNGSPTGKTTPATLERLPKGEHTITVRKEWFQPQTQRISLSDGEDKQLDMVMQPTFGTVNITAQDNAAIYVAGERKGNSQWEGRLTAGLYSVEARKDKHHSDSKQLQVRIGESHTLSLHPTPMQGQLKVTTIPMDAKIMLDGKEHGTTPETIRNLLVGTYSLTLQKTGYGTVTKTITIADGKTTEVDETLIPGTKVTIASTPSGANIYVDGQKHGEITPTTLILNPGFYNITLKKNRYLDASKTIEIREGVSQDIEMLLQPYKGSIPYMVRKHRNLKITYGIATVATLSAGTYLRLSANALGKEYKTATTNATEIYDKLNQHDLYSWISFGASVPLGIITIVHASKQKQMERKANFSFQPLNKGMLLGLNYSF
ncbi:MAG TPA: PEGA domain-containing protein [Tenuifilaceae bacterium]|nr:PEGA domain-containing protein [Tenuifilaceae bacterium]